MELVIEDPVGVSSLGELPMSGKGRNAADSAAIAFLGMTAAGAAGGPYGLAVGAALGLVLAPIAAIGGAIHGTDTVQPETWEANRNILAAITDGHWAEKLRSEVMAKLRDQQRLAAESDMSATRFGLWFEAPWLVIDGDDAIPTLTLHGELVADGACILDRYWRWNGEFDDFEDLGEENAKLYRVQLVHGLPELADGILGDLSGGAREVAFSKEAGKPAMIADPGAFENTLGSWDNPATASDLRCVGLSHAIPKVRPEAVETLPSEAHPDAFD